MFADDAPRLLDNVDRFLAIAAAQQIKVGLAFFGDCFDHAPPGGGLALAEACVPVKGRHNGCWLSSPLDAERTSVGRFEPFVTGVVSRFANDSRVAWWEAFNEPARTPDPRANFSEALRIAAYGWAKAAAGPNQPVFSMSWDHNTTSWGDNNATDVVNHHDYTTSFVEGWSNAIYSDVAKGAFVSEVGGNMPSGVRPCPLLFLHAFILL